MIRVPVSARRRKRQRGNTLLELGVCLVSFLLLTFGAIDFGLGVYAYGSCYYLSRDASRWAQTHGSGIATASDCSGSPGIAGGCAANSSDVSSYVSNLAIGLDRTQLTVTTTWTPDTTPGSEVNVRVAYAYAPVSGLGIKSTLNLWSSSQMEMVH
jgi:Flp pilus assembly protein TadG